MGAHPMLTPAHHTRDLTMTRRVLAGESCRVVAQAYGLSRDRVQQIVHAFCREHDPAYYAQHWAPCLRQLRADRQALCL